MVCIDRNGKIQSLKVVQLKEDGTSFPPMPSPSLQDILVGIIPFDQSYTGLSIDFRKSCLTGQEYDSTKDEYNQIMQHIRNLGVILGPIEIEQRMSEEFQTLIKETITSIQNI